MARRTSTSQGFAPPARPTVQRTVDSPVGPLTLMGDGDRLTHLLYDHQVGTVRAAGDDPPADATAFGGVVEQLMAYFAGDRTDFDLSEFDVTVAPAGTAFQLAVWSALTDIPYGTTCSYGELAARVGRPGAARAVGAANGRNPVSIIVPCHRVIGAAGTLTGYGGGLDRKATLLALEHDHAEPRLPLDVA